VSVSPVSQPLREEIFHFTEIRICRMCCPSQLILEGRSYVVTDCEPGLRWTRQRRHEMVRAGRVVPVSPRLRADERRCSVRLANILAARVHTAARPCGDRRTRVRQNRVVLAVVATAKLFAEMWSAQPGQPHRQFAERGRPEGIRLPGEHGISRQTTAQGRPCVGLHLYAAVRSPCATTSRSGPRVRAGTRPSLRPLG
jgi:hypothetical protein